MTALLAVDHVGNMDGRFFVRSFPGTRALAHYIVGDYRNAGRFYRLDLAQRAATVPAGQAWSWTTLMRGDLEAAAFQAREELGRAPEDPAPLLTLAEVALADGQHATAIELADRVRRVERDDYDALLVTAVARARQGQRDAAIDAMTRALRYARGERRITVFLSVLELTGELESRPPSSRPDCLLAHLHRYLRIYDASHAGAAMRYARRAIDAGDRADDAYVTLAVIQAKRGYRRAALMAYQRALEINRRNTAALLGAARYRADLGEIADEYRLTQAAFVVAPEDAFIAATFHELLMTKLGDYAQAREMAETAVTADPRNGEGWWRLAHVRSYLGDHAGALDAYRRAATLLPRAAELQTNIGKTLVELDRPADAMVAYKRALELDHLAPEPHYGLGRLYGKDQRWADALREFEIGYALGGRDINQVVGLCELYWEVGNAARATLCLGEVLTRDPDNQRGHALLEHVRPAPPRLNASR